MGAFSREQYPVGKSATERWLENAKRARAFERMYGSREGETS
jgi:hypothetical protein